MTPQIDSTVRDRLAGVEVGEPLIHANLCMFPLRVKSAPTPEYVTLSEALDEGWVRVTEVSESGSVPELRLVNEGPRPVLMIDGEELIGAKQNRTLNLTILVAPGSTLIVPVSCVESGRWSWSSETFERSPSTLYAKARALSLETALRSAVTTGRARSDQSGLWREIARKASSLGSSPRTGAMAEIYRDRSSALDAFVEALTAGADQAGAAFAIDGALAGVDLFEHPATLARLFARLVRSYALDAVESEPNRGKTPTVEAARGFLDEVAAAEVTEVPAIGLGKNLRLSSRKITGGALVLDPRLVHLGAFRKHGAAGDGLGRDERPIRRRSWRGRCA